MKASFLFINTFAVLLFAATNVSAQLNAGELAGQVNTITTAVPFLIIAPDARAGAMGDAGVASTPDVYSNHWNPSKFAFIEKDMGFGISYSPWLRALIPDVNLAYLSAYKKLNKIQTISASFSYFSLGDIRITNTSNNLIKYFKPEELAFDLAYSRKLSENFSLGTALRYIYSDLTGSQNITSKSFAADISAYYNKEMEVFKKKSLLAIGLNVSNIGSKISYAGSIHRDFIPINLRFGPCFTVNLNQKNSISVMCDLNKLLVPTPDTSNHNLNTTVVSGMFHSFSDAPGGAKEEFREINYSTGIEYWYNKLFAIRAGYFYEHPTKGNRQFFTLGVGVKYNVFGFDFSYLTPAPSEVKSPLANTFRFSLTLNFEKLKKN